jgi:hypothetical protein
LFVCLARAAVVFGVAEGFLQAIVMVHQLCTCARACLQKKTQQVNATSD